MPVGGLHTINILHGVLLGWFGKPVLQFFMVLHSIKCGDDAEALELFLAPGSIKQVLDEEILILGGFLVPIIDEDFGAD